MLLDTRLTPIDGSVLVPMYRERVLQTKETCSFMMRNFVKTSIQSLFETSLNSIYLTNSGSGALRLFLKSLHGYFSYKKIAIPAFCCREVVEAILQAEWCPVLFDMGLSFAPDVKSVDFALKHNCDLFLWPNYWGFRKRNFDVLQYAIQNDLHVIFDEAQSFPFSEPLGKYKQYASASILSFGKTKRSCGTGGGALVLQNEEFAEQVSTRYILSKANATKSLPIKKTKTPKKYYLNLDEWLSKEAPSTVLEAPISSADLRFIYDYLLNKSHYEVQLRKNYQCLEKYLKSYKSNEIIPVKGHEGVATIFAVRVRSNNRYKIMSQLANRRIQSTWYYFPISLQERYRHLDSENRSRSIDLAAEIMILPCQATHSIEDMEYVGEALCSL